MTATAYDRLLDRLHDLHKIVKLNGRSNQAMAQCPAHDDGNPSLSIRQFPQRAKLKCFAGCNDEAVLAALGLQVRDLFDDQSGARYLYEDGWTVHRSWEKQFRQTRPQGQPSSSTAAADAALPPKRSQAGSCRG